MRLNTRILSLVSCFVIDCQQDDVEENYPITPQIQFGDIVFDKKYSILKFSFSFTDGDGNFGIEEIVGPNNNSILNENEPFHPYNFYVEDGSPEFKEIGTDVFYADTASDGNNELVPLRVLNIEGKTGVLVTNRTSQKPAYSFLPDFSINDICYSFSLDYLINTSLFIREPDWEIVDASINVSDTTVDVFGNRFLMISDTLYYTINPNYYNLEVDFLVKQADGSFIEFDWRKEYCNATYDARLLQFDKGLTEEPPFIINARSRKSGTITYDIFANGFATIFSTKPIKLRMEIRDRDFNESNVIETPEFTIKSITR
jgi:hypothetical protein